MGWTRYRSGSDWIWRCTDYADLNYATINNLAEYGQPFSPYEKGFDQDYVPDFAKVVVEMPQAAVMGDGYGQTIEAKDFPVVKRFLRERLNFPTGAYTFAGLVSQGFAARRDRTISASLYKMGVIGLQPGTIGAADAAYIHGSVAFALMAGTRFTYSPTGREVDAEIGALNDNWDFKSANVWDWVNGVVAAALGPDHYNLEAPIEIRFTGPGKRSTVKVSNPSKVEQFIAPLFRPF